MVKIQIKFTLEPKVLNKLISKANAAGFNGRGAVSHYITYVATHPIAFIDEKFLEILEKEE
jgi:hypothetical protein